MKRFFEALIPAAVLIAIVAGLFALHKSARADEIIFSTYSYHFFQRGTNNENWGLHYAADNGVAVGVYNNSTPEPGHWRSSFHLGYGFPIYRPEWLSAPITMTVGGVTGYSEGQPINFFFAFGYRQKLDKNWGIHYTIGALQVINVGLGYRFF